MIQRDDVRLELRRYGGVPGKKERARIRKSSPSVARFDASMISDAVGRVTAPARAACTVPALLSTSSLDFIEPTGVTYRPLGSGGSAGRERVATNPFDGTTQFRRSLDGSGMSSVSPRVRAKAVRCHQLTRSLASLAKHTLRALIGCEHHQPTPDRRQRDHATVNE